uniref:NADH dehydrogenase subunit 2 n=1 Tax=Quadrella coronata TaxID=652071 RepID=UPI0028D5B4F1|nr:NADH dehydrogenase subunit 2 [Quadrella coronata]WMQ53298.1 NADH dehydrogenase subunit 2 [Quadrella coronata]
MIFPTSSWFFFFPLISGSFLAISSTSWFLMWVGLELNLMSFIPLIMIKMNPYLSETALKYFLIQALGSTFIIMFSSLNLSLHLIIQSFILMALLLKMGAAPFHFWFPHVMTKLNWPQIIILVSVQKIAPMYLTSYFMMSQPLIFIISLSAIMSAIIGAINGLNILNLRKIMAFSSINHLSWMLIAISINDYLWWMYFSFYILISSSVIIFFYLFQTYTISQLSNTSSSNPYLTLTLPFSLLSLGGLPPFSGFIPKWIMIQAMMTNSMFIPLFFLILSSLITIYFYLRILTPFILFYTPLLNNHFKFSLSSLAYMIFIIISNILSLLIPIPFMYP